MKNALEELRSSIPPFASWQISNLDNTFSRYLEILKRLCSGNEFAGECRPLLENAALIEWLISDLKACGSAVSYDRAAMELTWDIEALIAIMSR